MSELKFISAIILFLICTSCSSVKTTPVSYQCPQIKLPADPVPATRHLTARSKPNEVIKAWVATALAYREWDIIVRKQVQNSK